MDKIKTKYESILETTVKISYLCLALCTFNPFLYTSSIQPVFVKITLVMGVILILVRVSRYRKYAKMPCLILMILFCASFLLSTLMNREYGIVDNGKWIVWTGIQFFALYVCNLERDKKSYYKEFVIVSHIMIFYSMIASIISITMLFSSYSQMITTADGEFIIFVFTWGRLWGVYTDPNYGAVFSVIAVILSLLFLIKYKGIIKCVYILSLVLNLIYIIFSDSRTGEIALICSVDYFLLRYLFGKNGVKNRTSRKITAVVLVCVLSSGCIGGIRVIKSAYNYIQMNVAAEQTKILEKNNQTAKAEVEKNQTSEKNNQAAKADTKVGREADLEDNISNGRFSLWKSAVEVWRTSPLYGTGYSTFVSYAKEHVPDTYAVNNEQGDYTSMHNSFISTLAFQGILGLGILLILAGRMLWYIRDLLFKSTGEYALEHSATLSCIGVVVISMTFLLEGLYTISAGSFVLWTFSGYLVHFSYQTKKEDNV